MISILLSRYAALNDDGDDDKCLVFEFAFTRFTAVLTLCEIDELVCNQLVQPLKCNFDEVCVSFSLYRSHFVRT